MIITCLVLGSLLILSFLVYASYSIRSEIYLRSFCRKRTGEKVIVLTFDDGPDPIQTPKVLKVLKEHQATACFFCIGHKIEGNEKLLQQMVAEGHLIGNHSFTHSGLFPLYRLSRMKKDLQTCQSELERVTSQPVTLFRPPFGVTNPTIAKAVRQLGYTSIGWNIRTLDTQQPSPEKVLDRIRKGLKPGSIILLHDRMPNSGQLVKQILDLLKKQGYTIVRLDELLA
ncbi:polysaccharide deacetylase family protein [Bacteroides acidifaciens]|uniref:polysaccharide deacetylase family protein n=1 Tax=Bacteroides acidifaciens TaxID=85831 RepID=UPI00046AAA6D|nr:polysaccharide deacetylase family protein [Bacteroides acidifaciens]MCR1997829.1 polysaccharide deacetylase family protein [Bacteroides acidifaciens]